MDAIMRVVNGFLYGVGFSFAWWLVNRILEGV